MKYNLFSKEQISNLLYARSILNDIILRDCNEKPWITRRELSDIKDILQIILDETGNKRSHYLGTREQILDRLSKITSPNLMHKYYKLSDEQLYNVYESFLCDCEEASM